MNDREAEERIQELRNKPPTLIEKLPNGTVVKYRNDLWFLTPGIDARVATRASDGMWQFLREIKTTRFKVVFRPKKVK